MRNLNLLGTTGGTSAGFVVGDGLAPGAADYKSMVLADIQATLSGDDAARNFTDLETACAAFDETAACQYTCPPAGLCGRAALAVSEVTPPPTLVLVRSS